MTEFPEPAYQIAVYREAVYWRERKGRLRLVGSRCKNCNQVWWPPRVSQICPNCSSFEQFEDYEFPHEGELFAFMQDNVPEPVMGTLVYGRDRRIIASVRLKEGVLVSPTELVDCELSEVKEGMKVQLVLRKMRRANNGNWLYGYMWTPVREKK